MASRPSPSQGHHSTLSMLEDFGAQSARLTKDEREGIGAAAQQLFETQGPGAATAFLASKRGYANYSPEADIGRYMAAPVDYERYYPIASSAFEDLLGRTMSNADWQKSVDYAKAMGARDPSDFQSLISQRIASSPAGQSRMKTESDVEFESRFGPLTRDKSGNLARGFFYYNPDTVEKLATSMLGIA